MIERACPCKINLLLEVLARRPDGFHELETILHPIAWHDILQVREQAAGITLSCSEPKLPLDRSNLVYRAAELFLTEAGIKQGARIHLEKKVPLAAGLGGGSSDAAHTLQALQELFGCPLPKKNLQSLAQSIGSDVPFFLQSGPAIASGRGEVIQPLSFFRALRQTWLLLLYPGFGVSTAWAYSALGLRPDAPASPGGRAEALAHLLRKEDLPAAANYFYNSLEKPVLKKYPLLQLYQEQLREAGAVVTLMSGSGSTTFAIFNSAERAAAAAMGCRRTFGPETWVQVLPMLTE